MGYTIKLLSHIRHRYIANATLACTNASAADTEAFVLIDTGAFNTMIDADLAEGFASLLPLKMHISIGGNLGVAQGCIVHELTLGGLKMQRVFALAYPFTDWLTRHIILGANVLNNWDFTTSRADDEIRFVERIPIDVPNRVNPYQNYFVDGGYVSVQGG